MIQIKKLQNNDVVLTLTEKCTTTDMNFLFEFTHQMTGKIIYFISEDVSTALGRYNEFIITDQVTESPLAGKMDFLVGFHTYKIYNIPVGDTSLDPLNAIEVVEVGKVEVIGTANSPSYYQPEYKRNEIPSWNG
jgi:hypothetical protein